MKVSSTSLRLSSLALVAALGAGCPDNTPAADAAVAVDASGGGSDTGSTPDDTGSPGADAPATSDVARCTSTAAMVATACAGQADRTCEHTQGGMRCTTERADVLADAYQCLLDASTGTGSCRTYGDPSGATSCLDTLASETTLTAAGTALVDHIVALCSTLTRTEVIRNAPVPIMALSDATIGRLDTCISAAADCDAAEACVLAEYATIAACYP